MKAWINKLGGVLLASLLTVMLNGKAYADLEPAHEELNTEIVEPDETPAAAPTVEVPTEVPTPAAPPVVDVAPPAAVPAPIVADPVQEISAPAAESVVDMVVNQAAEVLVIVEPETPAIDAAIEVPAIDPSVIQSAEPSAENMEPVREVPAAEPVEPVDVVPEAVEETSASAVKLADEPEVSAKNVTLKAFAMTPVKTEALPDSDSETSAEDSNVLDPAPVVNLSAEPMSAASGSELDIAAEELVTLNASQDLSTALRTAPLAKNADDQSEAPSGVLRKLDDGTYIMVGYQDESAVISTNNPVLNILAAGLNKISSLSSGGSINIGGTGIFLVDSLQYGSGGSLNLMPNTEQYGENGGSVAVFCKQEGTEKDYVFVNGTVPGRLDEAYSVEGCNLILPSGAKLILSSVGQATNIESQEVTYYSGEVTSADSDPLNDLLNYDKYFYEDETAASLTIGKGASLVVESGAEVESIVTPCLSKKSISNIIAPSLKVTDNGILTVNGNLNGGVLSVGESASVKGSGTVSAEQMVIHSPSCLSGSNVTFHSRDCTIYGSGTIDTLKLNSSNVFLNSGEGSVTINNIVSSSPAGSPNELIAGNSMTLGNISLTGDLALLIANGYGQSSVVNTLKGKVNGGTLFLGSGIYQLVDGFSCSSSSLNTDNRHVIVYDYSDGFVFSDNNLKAPLLVDPDTVKMPGTVKKTEGDQMVEYYEVPLIKVEAWESGTGNAGLWFDLKEVVSLDPLLIPVGKTGIYLKELHETLTSGSSTAPVLMYELQYLENGIFCTVFFTDPTIDNSFSCFSGENLYLIRVSELTSFPGGQGGSPATSTQTSYTGSGVLGGSGAGSITIGGVTYNLSTATDVNLHPTPDPNPSPDPGPSPNPDPIPVPDPEPGPLVVTVDMAPVEAPLVWAEVTPTVGNDAVSPCETQFVVLALEGEKTLEKLGGKATVALNYTPPAEYAGKTLYVVFRNEDGTLTAIRATYSDITGLLRFITDRLGTFMVVGFDFDGEEFSEEFYEALAQIPELKDLVFAEYSPV